MKSGQVFWDLKFKLIHLIESHCISRDLDWSLPWFFVPCQPKNLIVERWLRIIGASLWQQLEVQGGKVSPTNSVCWWSSTQQIYTSETPFSTALSTAGLDDLWMAFPTPTILWFCKKSLSRSALAQQRLKQSNLTLKGVLENWICSAKNKSYICRRSGQDLVAVSLQITFNFISSKNIFWKKD